MSDDDDIPAIGELEEGQTARVEYFSKRSGNPVEREGTVAQMETSEKGNAIAYVHTDQKGFFRHTFVALIPAKTTEDNNVIAAVSLTTKPKVDADDPPVLGKTYGVEHHISRRQTLGIAQKVIRVTPDALTPNTVL